MFGLFKKKDNFDYSLFDLITKKINQQNFTNSILVDNELSQETNIPLMNISKDKFEKEFDIVTSTLHENLQDYLILNNIYLIRSRETDENYLLVKELNKVDLSIVTAINFDKIFLATEKTMDIFLSRKEDLKHNITAEAGATAFLEEILDLAKVRNASDIYITLRGHQLSVRLRTSSNIYPIAEYGLNESIILRNTLEVMANEEHKTKWYDSKIIVNNREYRIGFLETVAGYRITIRNYSSQFNSETTLEDLGYTEQYCKIIRNISDNQTGMFLFTAQTGQGKTTTQNTVLEDLSKRGLEVVEVADVVERKILTMDQIDLQAYETADEKFKIDQNGAIKRFLRQKPDVINIGEIRDETQAKEALKASITGHLTFGSLHTNNVYTAVIRMIEDGKISLENLKAVVRGILYQQLTRQLCPNCKIKLDKGYRANIENGCGKNGCEDGYLIIETPIPEIAEFPVFKDFDFKKTESYENYISLEQGAKEKYELGIIDKLHYEAVTTGKRKPNLYIVDSYYNKHFNVNLKALQEDLENESA